MGLDIYLYKYNNLQDTLKREEEYEKRANTLWEVHPQKYEDMAQSVKNEINKKCKEIETELGLDEWGEDIQNSHKIEMNHPSYPEHYFKIGYWRSSYNDSGIDHLIRVSINTSLSSIMNVNPKEYVSKIDWEKSLVRMTNAFTEFKEHTKKYPFAVLKYYEWYYQAFEIMIDTIKWVLKQPDKDKYYLKWSE